jgi:hypothetical protein
MFSTNAQSIFNALIDAINQVELNWQSVTAVCFIGAATMSALYNGVQTNTKVSNHNILFMHYHAHC